MRTRLRWLAVAMAGLVVVAAAISFAPRPIPGVPAPVRLTGEVVTATDSSTNELVVVPVPAVDLGSIPVTTTTISPSAPPSTVAPAGTADPDDDHDLGDDGTDDGSDDDGSDDDDSVDADD